MLKKIFYYGFNLTGKANRSEFAIYFVIELVLLLVALELSTRINHSDFRTYINLFYIDLILLVVTTPTLSATTRRLRYLNLSTNLILISFIPFISSFFRLFLLIKSKK
ncbi:DUF805 domain-containing protein [Paenimyroides viscosum]|uniref:DUF805 domain-containing protein n=1 Tax=Paenimyroides viscosum TaxID=2488729 RepID=A0A3P1B263_9FLAO|nr:DUF805 domain-containing protein [Paenimyroides viscosum]